MSWDALRSKSFGRDTHGLLKLLVSPEDRTILGVHVLGTNATEVVPIGQTVMGLNGTIDYLVDASSPEPLPLGSDSLATRTSWRRDSVPQTRARVDCSPFLSRGRKSMTGQLATEVPLDAEALQGFVEGVRGAVLRPGDQGYDDARAIWNGLIDRRPALIVQCTGAADVVDAVNFAREQNLLLSVKGGGHNVAGNAVNDGGLVIDLSQMRGVHVDPSTRTVRAQGGATWGDCDRETQLFGLAVPGGVVSTTGIAGLTLHGGVGHLRRKHGLSIDNLLSVDIVTADGQLRTGERDRERGSLLGRARRRQQLRRRHLVRVPGAPGRPDGHGRRDLLPAGGREGRCCRRGATTWPRRRRS